jgi:3-dehydrosphinganine reductase
MRTTAAVAARHAIVTGGSSGIGLALVRRLASLGARVSVIALEDENLARLRQSQPSVSCISTDVGDRGQAQAAVSACVDAHGPCDLLFTCAGIVRPGYFMEIPDEDFERQMRVNYFGTLWPIRAVVPSMIAGRSGSIMAISSFGGLMGVFGLSAYGPSKYAVRALCETLRLELAPHGIYVAGVYPTDVDTPMLAYEKPLHPPEEDAMQGTVKPMSPEVVVDAILGGLRRRQARIYPGRRTSALAHLVTAAPELATRYANWAIARDRRTRAPDRTRPGTITAKR